MKESIIKPYNDILTKIIKQGIKTDSTLALINETVSFNLDALNGENHYSMILPRKRAYLDTSSKYAIAEAIWYRAATQSIDVIKPFGKIWEKMIDHDGKINSNYGYQIKNNNMSLDDCADEIIKKGSSSLYIASFKNQTSSSDLVCNNKVTFYLHQNKLQCLIHARSIDVIFGLPYDFFAAQGLMMMIADLINQKTKQFTQLTNLTFSIANVHWYLNQNPNEESLSHLSDEVVVIEDFNSTPYSNQYHYTEISTDEVKACRDKIDYQTLTYAMYNINDNNNIYASFDYHMQFNTLSEAIEHYLEEIEYDDQKEILKHHIENIHNRLIKNPWERKTLLMTSDKDLHYIMFDGQYFNCLGVFN